MSYKTLLHPKAAREFKVLPPDFKERLQNRIHLLEEKPDRDWISGI
jgi:mRNA-degrading endonuclease RelE of RelBE toxin-antitoxin system